MAGNKVGVGAPEPIAKRRFRSPPQRRKLGYVEELARRPVRLRAIEGNAAAITGHPDDELGELRDGHILAGADVEVFLLRVVLKEENASVGEVVNEEKLASWGAGAPHRDARRVGKLGLVKSPDERGHHVAGLRLV